MKKIIVISFAFLYAVALLQPYMPLINYALNKDYIAKVLCVNKDKPQMHCNGKCHLNKELKKAANEQSKTNVIQAEFSDYLQTDTTPLLNFYHNFIAEISHSYSRNYSSTDFSSVFHPPTC